MPPIKVNFEIPYFTVSGIQVGGGAAFTDILELRLFGVQVCTRHE